MINLMYYAVCFLWRAARTGVFTNPIHNSAVSAFAYIPSGGRVGAARLIRQMALYRV